MLGVKTAAKLAKMAEQTDLCGARASDLAIGGLYRKGRCIRRLTEELLANAASDYATSVAVNIKIRCLELGLDAGPFHELCDRLCRPGFDDDVDVREIQAVARQLNISPAVLLTPDAFDPNRMPTAAECALPRGVAKGEE